MWPNFNLWRPVCHRQRHQEVNIVNLKVNCYNNVMQIRPRRPRRLCLALYLIVGLGLINGARAIAWQAQQAALIVLKPSLSPNLASGGALVWAIFFLIIGWLAWRNRPVSRILLSVGLSVYGAYRLISWQLWVTSPLTRRSESLLLVGFAVVAGYLIWAFNSRRTRRYLAANRQNFLTNESSEVTFHSLTSG